MKWLLQLIDVIMRKLYPPMPSTDDITEVLLQTHQEAQNTPQEAPVATTKTKGQVLYETAAQCLGQHMSLNNAVPISVGCAEALSAVLKKAGFSVPKLGIAGTTQMLAWLETNPAFVEVSSYKRGQIIISATGTGNGKIRGHCGVEGDKGIMSNESQSGLWKEQWDIDSWNSYYERYGGIPTRYFQAIDT